MNTKTANGPKEPLISMIVSNINGMHLNLLEDCLNSLMKPGYPNWELIVVDNDSTDNSVEYLKKKFEKHPNCIIALNPVNMYSQGLNLGAKYASGEYLAYFNNDVALENGYFQELITQFDKDKKLGIAQGKLLNYFNRDTIDSAGETMDRFGNPVTIGAGEKDTGQYDQIKDILSASGSACMIKKTVFDEVGRYDNDYGIGYEDMDLALRFRRLGYKVRRFPKAVVFHKRASTDLAAFIRIKVKWHFNKNRITTMIKNYPWSMLLSTLPFTILLYCGIACYEFIIRRNFNIGRVRLTSMFWVITNIFEILSKRKGIEGRGSKPLSQQEFQLFSPKSLLHLFVDFIKGK